MSPITFCIGTSNNLEYLKLAVHSVRTYSHFKDSPFIVYAENCTDGTDEWLKENYIKYNITPHIEHNDIPNGIGGGMNFCAERVKTEYIMFLHADMFVSKNWDLEAFVTHGKHHTEQTPPYIYKPVWVSSYRIQPNVFHEDSRPGTLVVPVDYFGEYAQNFDEATFISYAQEFAQVNDVEIRKGEGVSGLIRKIDWDSIGGNDPRFNPLSFDDMDLFIRMQNAGFKFVLTSKSVVYHFGSRSSNGHFPTNDLTQRSPKQNNFEQRNLQRFIEKWGQPPQQDDVGFIKPIETIVIQQLKKNVVSSYSTIHHPIEVNEATYSEINFDGSQKPYEFFETWKLIDANLPNTDSISFLEIGAYKGLWAIAFVEWCKLHNKKPIYTTVTMISQDPNNQPLYNVEKHYKDVCDWLLIDANSQLESTKAEVIKRAPHYDFVFIDADHSYDGVLKDIQLYAPLARKLLFFHDIRTTNNEGLSVYRAITDSQIKLDYEIACEPHNNVMGIGIKKI